MFVRIVYYHYYSPLYLPYQTAFNIVYFRTVKLISD